MTLKQLEKLNEGDFVRVTKNVDKEGRVFRVRLVRRYYSSEPKYTVRQFLELPVDRIEKLKNWVPKIMDGTVLLEGLTPQDEEWLHTHYAYMRRYGINYRVVICVEQPCEN